MRNSLGRFLRYGSSRRMDSACMARQSCQLHARLVAIAHDLPSVLANRRNHRGRVPHFDEFARTIQTGPCQCRGTLSALSYRRSCSADYLSSLDVLVARDRSEERRVGKEWGSRWAALHEKKILLW